MEKTIIISGAAGNLGQAVTQKFLEEGFFVEGIVGPGDNPDFIHAEQLRTHIVNLTLEKEAEAIVKKISDKHQALCGAVLTVGGFAMGSIRETSAEHLEAMYQLNFQTAYFLVKPLLDILADQENGGQIVFIGARPALVPAEGKDMVAYSLSKSLIFQFAELINATWQEKGITASVIVPSILDTPENRSAMPENAFQTWVPPGRVAEVIHFLFTDAGRMLREPVIKVYHQS